MERESFKSRLGFLLVSAGCAIGIGNVWRFPFVVGQNGGGFFVRKIRLFSKHLSEDSVRPQPNTKDIVRYGTK